MRVSILMDIPDSFAAPVFENEDIELELRNYRTGYMARFRRGEFVAVKGDNVAEIVALRVVQILKEWNGEAPLNTSDLKLVGGLSPEKRLAQIREILETVDNRCLAVEGPVPPTRLEITDKEFRAIYVAAGGK